MTKRSPAANEASKLIKLFENSHKIGRIEGGISTLTKRFVPTLAKLAVEGNGVAFREVVDAYTGCVCDINNDRVTSVVANYQALDFVQTLCQIADVKTGYQKLSRDDERNGVPEGIVSHQFWRIYSGRLAKDNGHQGLLGHEIRVA